MNSPLGALPMGGRVLLPLLLLSSSVIAIPSTPEIHDWIETNIHICDLDPPFGRTRFLSREEATIFRCRCGPSTTTKMACAQHLDQRPFCETMPVACYESWMMQFAGPQVTLPPSPHSHNSSLPPLPVSSKGIRQKLRAASDSPRNVTRKQIRKALPVAKSVKKNRLPVPFPTLIPQSPLPTSTTHRPPPSNTPRGEPHPNSAQTVIFETFPSLHELRLSAAARALRQRKMEERLVEFKDEINNVENKRFLKTLTFVKAVKRNPAMHEVTADLDAEEVARAIATREETDTQRRLRTLVELGLKDIIVNDSIIREALKKNLVEGSVEETSSQMADNDDEVSVDIEKGSGIIDNEIGDVVRKEEKEVEVVIDGTSAVSSAPSTTPSTTTREVEVNTSPSTSTTTSATPSPDADEVVVEIETTSPLSLSSSTPSTVPSTSTTTTSPSNFTEEEVSVSIEKNNLEIDSPSHIASKMAKLLLKIIHNHPEKQKETATEKAVESTTTSSNHGNGEIHQNGTSAKPSLILSDAVTSKSVIVEKTPPPSTATPTHSSTTTLTSTTQRARMQPMVFTTSAFNPRICEDNHSLCRVWSKYGECRKNPGYMYKYCRSSCGICALLRR